MVPISRRTLLFQLADAAANHPDRVIEKVIGANFHRAFSEIWVSA